MRFRDVLSLVYHVKVMKNIDDKIHVFCTAIPVISNGTADVTLGVLFNWWDLWLLTPGDAICCERVEFFFTEFCVVKVFIRFCWERWLVK